MLDNNNVSYKANSVSMKDNKFSKDKDAEYSFSKNENNVLTKVFRYYFLVTKEYASVINITLSVKVSVLQEMVKVHRNLIKRAITVSGGKEKNE